MCIFSFEPLFKGKGKNFENLFSLFIWMTEGKRYFSFLYKVHKFWEATQFEKISNFNLF